MIYLDYSATTPVDKKVLEVFNKVCLDYPGNSNSLHKILQNIKIKNYISGISIFLASCHNLSRL